MQEDVTLSRSVFQSFSSIGPMLDVVAIFSLITIYSGIFLPVVVAISFLISFTTINSVVYLSRRYRSNGGYYSYAGSIFGKPAGLFTGFLYVAYSFLVLPDIVFFDTSFLGSVFPAFIHLYTVKIFVSVIFVVSPLILVSLGLKRSILYTIAAGVSELAFILVLGILLMVYRDPVPAVYTAQANPVVSVFQGLIFGILAFSGGASSIFLSENTRNGKKTVPRALLISYLATGSSMIFVSVGIVLFLGNSISLYSQNPIYLITDADSRISIVLGIFVISFVILSSLNLTVSYMNALRNSVRKMIRDGIIPGGLSFTGTTAGFVLSSMCVSIPTVIVMSYFYGFLVSFTIIATLVSSFYVTIHIIVNSGYFIAVIRERPVLAALPVVSTGVLGIALVSTMVSAFPAVPLIGSYLTVLIIIAAFAFLSRATDSEYYRNVEFNVE
jgi:amino acid transporter